MSNQPRYYGPLDTWIYGQNSYMKSPLHIRCEDYTIKSSSISFEISCPIHLISALKLSSFDYIWNESINYIQSACKILGRDQMLGWSMSERERNIVISKLGEPPIHCYCLYMISVGEGKGEKCVYIGKTNSTNHRFRAGHSALTKLHAPEFGGMKKTLYLASVYLEDDDDHLFPIEFVPVEKRKDVLEQIENRLIYDYQPELNTKGKMTNPTTNIDVIVNNTKSSLLSSYAFGA